MNCALTMCTFQLHESPDQGHWLPAPEPPPTSQVNLGTGASLLRLSFPSQEYTANTHLLVWSSRQRYVTGTELTPRCEGPQTGEAGSVTPLVTIIKRSSWDLGRGMILGFLPSTKSLSALGFYDVTRVG